MQWLKMRASQTIRMEKSEAECVDLYLQQNQHELLMRGLQDFAFAGLPLNLKGVCVL